MTNKDGAERACKEPNPIIDGRKANVNLAYLGAKPRGIATDLSLSGKLHFICHTCIHIYPILGQIKQLQNLVFQKKDGNILSSLKCCIRLKAKTLQQSFGTNVMCGALHQAVSNVFEFSLWK